MAPHTSSACSRAPPVPSFRRRRQPVVVQADTDYRCTFCGEEFDNRFAFSAHYFLHRGLSDQTWIDFGPKNSKVRRRIMARLQGLDSLPKRKKAGRPPKPVRAMAVKPAGKARARSPQPIRATPIRAFFPPAASRQFQAGSSRVVPAAATGPGARLLGVAGLPVLRDYASWLTHFRKQPAGPVGRDQEPRWVRVHKENGAGPSSNAGSGVADKAPAEFGPPPGFGHVLPDLNFPIPKNIIKPVKKEIIIID